jgi:two-component system cell cycle sensor histidine kinase/response regulator CckA
MTQKTNISRIGRIIEAIRKAIDGDYSFHIETSDKNDEIDVLTGAINQLAESMDKHFIGHKKFESALLGIEKKYRRLEANIPGMVYLFVMHPDGTFSFPYVNEASQKLFGISPENLMRDATLITRLIHPDDRERFDMSVKRSAETLQPWREVLRHIVHEQVRWYDCISRPELQTNGDILWDGIILEVTNRMKAEESLSKSQKELSEIISVSPVGIAIYDGNGQCISTNDSFASIIGATKQQVLEQNYGNIESWRKTGLLDMARTAVRTKSAKRHEVVTTSSFGKEVFLDCHLVPFGEKGLLFMAQDITERKRTEEIIHHSEKQFKTLFMSMSDGFYLSEILFDDNGNPCDYRFLEVNPKFEQIMGVSRDQIIGKRYKELVPVDTTRWLDVYCKVARTGTPLTYEFYSDEYQMYFETYSYQPTKGQVSVFVRDITERKRAETALQQAKNFAEKLIESANAMIIVLDAEGKVQVFNKAAEEITGYTRQELVGYNWFEILVPKDKYPNVWEAFQKSARDGLPISFENPILTKAGEERFISWQNTELLENGAFIGSISYGIDITERKHLEKQLLQSQKMEAIGQLTGGIAHDFNNMLSVILGHAELIKSGLPSGDPLLKSVLEIENAGLHSRDITRQLLAFSRKQIIAPKTTNLNKLIVNIKKTLARLIGENIDLRFFPQRNLWNVRIDPTQVDQILFNLAVNARDAMPDGGALTIETSNVDLDEVYCALNMECRPGHYVLLSVADNGVGMDKETLSHVFEPFYTTKELGKGTGLGLATVYGITKQNGGFINIYSEPGKGTAFRIYIPRLMDEVEKEKVVEETPPEFHPATVLLVEDDDMVRRMTAAILIKIGYSVVLAESPMEALAVVEKEATPIDLLITDVVMPKMSGTELASKINKIKPEIKVLFMSGYTENVIVHQGALKEGIHFVQKPFSMNDFAKKVRETIEDK